MTISESKGRFFYKTNRFDSIRITNRIESIRIANWNALPAAAAVATCFTRRNVLLFSVNLSHCACAFLTFIMHHWLLYFLRFVVVSDVYIRRDLFGTIIPTSLVADNFVYFLSNGNATVSVDIQFTCDPYSYFFWQEITVSVFAFTNVILRRTV